MRDIILITGVAIAGLFALRRPSFGLLTFGLLGFVAPQSYMWGFGRTFPFSQVIAVSTVLGLILSAERKTLAIQRESLLLILLWLLFGASTLDALYPAKALEQLLLVSKIFFMIIVATMVINSDDKRDALIRIVGYSLGFYGLKGGLFVVLSGGEMIVYGPEGSFLYANNSIGLGLAMNIPVLLYLIKIETSPWLRWTLRLMLLFTYPAIVCTYSRGAWLGMLVVTAMGVLKSRKKVMLIGLACVVTIAGQLILSQKGPERLISRYDSLVNYEEDSSAQSRFWNWEFCKRVGLARPVAGGGFDLYGLESYATFYPEFLERWPGKVWSCHSTWLTIFAEHGISGSVIWLALVVSSLMSLRQIRAYGVTSGKLHVLKFSDMVQSSLLAYFVVGTFIDAAYFDILYYFIAFIIIQKGIAANGTQNSRRSLALVGSGKATTMQIQTSVPY
jgi:probable O-glycosylation ligase (exosortase A-associated)